MRGTVQVTSNGKVIRIRKPGDSMGVVNILTDSVNEFTVTTESPVTVLRIKYVKLQRLLNESSELEDSLWNTAAKIIAEPIIKDDKNYADISDSNMQKALANGITYKLKKDQEVKGENMLVVLLEGEVYNESKNETIKAPALIKINTTMASEGRVFAGVLSSL